MISTYLVYSLEDLHRYLPLIKKESLIDGKIHAIGFDAEYICKANHPKSFSNSKTWVENNSSGIATCTIQIASSNTCLIINLVKLGLTTLPKKLAKILVSDGWLKFGVGVDNDLKILSQNYNLGYCGGVIDLKSLALVSQHVSPNLECLYNQFSGEGVKKSYSGQTDWGTGNLTNEQIEYAAKDAVMSYKLAMKMAEHLTQKIKPQGIEISVKNKIETPPAKKLIKESPVKRIIKSTDKNYIGILNELAQKHNVKTPSYAFVTKNETHPIQFQATCYFQKRSTTSLYKNNKQDSKMEAAKLMLELPLKNLGLE